MTWFRVDDTFGTHPKVLGIPRARRTAAVGLWMLAGSWCARNLTDGAIPAYMIEELGGQDDEVKDLLSSGLWEEIPEGFRFHDYLIYNQSRAKVLADREAAAERQRQARERAAEKRRAAQTGSQRESRRDNAPNGSKRRTEPEQGSNPGTELPLGDMSQRDSRVTGALRHTQPERESHLPDPTRPDPKERKPRRGSAATKATPEGRIADAVYDHLNGMVTWVAVHQVAKRAMRVAGATEDRIVHAMCDLDAAGRPITLQTVGQVLSGALNLTSRPRDEPRPGSGVWDRVATREDPEP